MATIPAIAPASLAANAAQAKDAAAPDHEFAQALSDAHVPVHAPVKDDASKPAAGSKSKPQLALVADAPAQPVSAPPVPAMALPPVLVTPPQVPIADAKAATVPSETQPAPVSTGVAPPSNPAPVAQMPPISTLPDDEAEAPAPAPAQTKAQANSAAPSKLVAEILTAAKTAAPQAAPTQPSQTTAAAAAAANVGMAVKVTQRVAAETPKPAPAAKAPAKPDAKPATATPASNDDDADGAKSVAASDAKPDDAPSKDPATSAPDNVTQAVKGEPGPGHAAPTPVPAPAQSAATSAAMTPANAGVVTQAGAAQPLAKSGVPQDFTASNTPGAAPAADFGALAAKIAAKSTSGLRSFDIRMDPPELGRVEVHLSVDHDGQAQATLTAERPHTLDLLQRGSQELERALKDAGLNLSNSSLNFSLKGQDRQGDGGGASVAHTRSLLAAANAERDAAQASVSNLGHAHDSARLDIRV